MPAGPQSPLSAPVLHILLALAASDLHGYGIMQEVKAVSGGAYKIGPGTLYDNLRTLLAAGLVSDFEEHTTSENRRMYHLTATGQQLLELDLQRLGDVLRKARSRLRHLQPKEAR